jgi:pectate lyase
MAQAVLWGGVLLAWWCSAGMAALAEAFPGAQGWAAYTPGGRGGSILRVTTLDRDGPGSFAEAVRTAGPRIIVFEVGGVIDLDRRSVRIDEPYVTIAGQTAPSPGITFIRGGLSIQTHDVIVRHIRVRPGEAGAAKKSGWEVDGIATNAARDVIIDHCSCTWATDENLSTSGPRFEGDTVEQWRQGTSRRVTLSNNIIAEGLAQSTHSKGQHSKGTLIHDNATEIAIIGNLYAHNRDRNPFFKGGARGLVANNYIYNPGTKAIHYTLVASEWGDRPYATGQMVVIGNVLQHGPDTRDGIALVQCSGAGPCQVFMQDNLAFDREGGAVPLFRADSDLPGRDHCLVESKPFWPDRLSVLSTEAVREYVLENAGARPWDRDEIDRRIVAEVRAGGGRIIDSEQEVGGYPVVRPLHAAFEPQEWDLETMTRR